MPAGFQNSAEGSSATAVIAPAMGCLPGTLPAEATFLYDPDAERALAEEHGWSLEEEKAFKDWLTEQKEQRSSAKG